jgi:hypothetical protein
MIIEVGQIVYNDKGEPIGVALPSKDGKSLVISTTGELIQPIIACESKNDCNGIAETVVYDRNEGKLYRMCHYCADKVIDRENPEYVEYCPCCGCRFGVN